MYGDMEMTISVKIRWNTSTSSLELVNKVRFKSKYRMWGKRDYEVDSTDFTYSVRMRGDVDIAPTILSTWSK